jgi:hypothetical protein
VDPAPLRAGACHRATIVDSQGLVPSWSSRARADRSPSSVRSKKSIDVRVAVRSCGDFEFS